MKCAFLELSDHLNPGLMGHSESEQDIIMAHVDEDTAGGHEVLASSSDGGTNSKADQVKRASSSSTHNAILKAVRRYKMLHVGLDNYKPKGKKTQRIKSSPRSFKMKSFIVHSKHDSAMNKPSCD